MKTEDRGPGDSGTSMVYRGKEINIQKHRINKTEITRPKF